MPSIRDRFSGGKAWPNLGLLSVALISSLVAAELLSRIFFNQIDLLELTGRIAVPHNMSSWAFVDAFSAYRGQPGEYKNSGKTVNRHGFISTPELEVSKPANTIRIVFFGGSSTAGTGRNLGDTDTWPWKVGDIIQKNVDGKNIEFINAALGGYTSFESFGRFWSRIRFFSPDIIIVYHGWNEMYYFNQVEEITDWRTLSDGSWTFDKPNQAVEIYKPRSVDPLIAWSQLFSHLRLLFSKPNFESGEIGRQRVDELAHDYDRRGLEVWRTNLRLFKETARLFNVELFVCKQATLSAPGLSPEDIARCGYHYHGFDHDAHLDAFQRIYNIIDEEIAEANIIDLTSISGDPDYFYDAVHPTLQGSTMIAERVSEALLRSDVFMGFADNSAE